MPAAISIKSSLLVSSSLLPNFDSIEVDFSER